MPRPLDETWLRSQLASRIDGDDIVLGQWEQNGGTVVITVAIAAFVEMFDGVNVAPNEPNPAAVRDRLVAADTVRINPDTGQPDPNGVEAQRGYADYFRRWHKEGRFV